MKKAIILDRDGVINYDSYNYIKSPEEFNFIPHSIDAIVKLSIQGYTIGVATNQSGIARGFYDEEMLGKIHQKLIDKVRQKGGEIAAIVFCPHHPNEKCLCRKPNPGLLHKLATQLNIKLKGVPFIGDRFSDIQAANAVGARAILIKSQMTEPFLLTHSKAVPTFNSLKEAVDWLL
ncbi:MAG: D-glycero-beta-D-manno-heptose-1,7-bisphosphate 7-phosphatase [Legionellales bacterium RIFCSPHIGHO2_12_FULL_37_14]|nr:MAG: D-glycero-beta-D-manno-heptose-1,7-bisphosphate 7-phosphatase [Legionellales bacterium RIFCSPHIGHO2_12_FULL_37_14]